MKFYKISILSIAIMALLGTSASAEELRETITFSRADLEFATRDGYQVVTMVGCEALWVTKISDNPYITRTKARMQASNYDLPVNF